MLLSDPSCAKAHFYIGRLLAQNQANSKSRVQDTLLHFQYCVNTSSDYFAGNALYQMALLHVKNYDMDQALKVLSGISSSYLQSKKLQVLRDFIDGV